MKNIKYIEYQSEAMDKLEKQIEKIKDEIAVEVADVNYVQSNADRVIIKNMMKF